MATKVWLIFDVVMYGCWVVTALWYSVKATSWFGDGDFRMFLLCMSAVWVFIQKLETKVKELENS
jgi:hypothetical protein